MIRANKLLQLEEMMMKKSINKQSCDDVFKFIQDHFGLTPEEVADFIKLDETKPEL